MSDRHELQAAGKHPAPCARHCESTAYEIELRRLRHDIERHVGIATEATQEAERLRAEVERLRDVTNTPHFKPRSRADLKYLSHDELVSAVILFEMKYLYRSSMFFRLDQSHEKLRAELAASRHELVGAKKSARAQARIIESLQQQRAHLNAQRDQWIEARNTLDSERAANARLTDELAASREREARMQWQPIETAPRDGTMVLLAGGLAAPSDWRIKVGYWASEDGAWYIFGGSWRPTRWMPLDGLYAALAEGAKG